MTYTDTWYEYCCVALLGGLVLPVDSIHPLYFYAMFVMLVYVRRFDDVRGVITL